MDQTEQFGTVDPIARRSFISGIDAVTGGPPPFAKADRSPFLSALDEALVRLKRG
jgi:hypothetical protein